MELGCWSGGGEACAGVGEVAGESSDREDTNGGAKGDVGESDWASSVSSTIFTSLFSFDNWGAGEPVNSSASSSVNGDFVELSERPGIHPCKIFTYQDQRNTLSSCLHGCRSCLRAACRL